jgi:RNA polymerase sigma factor (sigma-70 family)
MFLTSLEFGASFRENRPALQNSSETRLQGSRSLSAQRDSITSATLLAQLQQSPADQAAWAEFVSRYGERIHGWCRQWGLQEADAKDISQTVLMKLVNAMQSFQYDPSRRFRAWLKTVTHHAWQDWMRARKKSDAGSQPAASLSLYTPEARDDLAARMEEAYERELLSIACTQVSLRVQPNIWNAFRLTALEGRSGVEAAAELGMPVTSVYKAKSNVQKLLEREVQSLETCVS